MPEHIPPTPAELAAWKAAAEAATPGPWHNRDAKSQECLTGIFSLGSGYGTTHSRNGLEVCRTVFGDRLANATFIAISRVALPRLLAEVERLRARTHEIQETESKARGKAESELARLRNLMHDARKLLDPTGSGLGWSANQLAVVSNLLEDIERLRVQVDTLESAGEQIKELLSALNEISETAFEGTGARDKRILGVIDRVDPIPTIPAHPALTITDEDEEL